MLRRRSSWHYTSALLFAPVAAAVTLFACAGDDVQPIALGGGCLVNSDCSSPLICAFRLCHQECKDDRDCSAGQRCVAGDRPYRVCQLDQESRCSYNSDCASTEVCAIDDQCRDQCAADRDCVNGQLCVTGTCADPLELVDGGLSVADGGERNGQPCAYTSQCPPDLVCRDGVCNYECLASADCMGFECKEHHCQYPDAGPIYCTPGTQITCGCVGDPTAGVQTCASDGQSFGACVGNGCP
jgi:hypothetical protein